MNTIQGIKTTEFHYFIRLESDSAAPRSHFPNAQLVNPFHFSSTESLAPYCLAFFVSMDNFLLTVTVQIVAPYPRRYSPEPPGRSWSAGGCTPGMNVGLENQRELLFLNGGKGRDIFSAARTR